MKKYVVILLVLITLSLFDNSNTVYSQEKKSYVTFSSVESTTLNPVILNDNIELGEVNLSQIGDKHEIQFELENPSNFDSTVELTINGSKEYQDDYIRISATDIKEIKKNSKSKGIITIELINYSEEELEIPFSIEIYSHQK